MVFYYAARAPDGGRIRGSIEADSRDAAAGHLRARSLYVTALETVATTRGLLSSLGSAMRRNAGARGAFFRSFATLIGAGIPVRRALETLVEQGGDAGFAEALRSIASDVEGGMAFSKAMGRHPAEFSPIAVATVRAGEVGGSLDGALRSIADLEERDRNLRKRIGAALAYPCMVCVAAVALVVFLIANTMPAFAAMFAQMRVPLPLTTRLLIVAGEGLRRPLFWVTLAGAAVGLAVSIGRLRRSTAPWAIGVDRLRLRLPVLGAIVAKSTVARFARTLGSLLRSGVDVVAALEASAGVVESLAYRTCLLGLIDALRRGETLAAAVDASGLFEGTFLQLVRAGEESGAIDTMLLRLAEYYELDVETALVAITSILEPALICVLGAVIGTIVASIIIPLYSMIGSIK